MGTKPEESILTKHEKMKLVKNLRGFGGPLKINKVLSNLPISQDCCSENCIMSFPEK
jgi:hypothetical protein